MIGSPEEFRDLVLAESEHEPNPYTVADRVVSKLAGDAEALRIALALVAPAWISTLIKRPHVGNRSGAPKTHADAEGGQRASAKQAGLVNWYVAQMRKSVKVGATTRDWKQFGACTLDDLTWMVQERREQSASNLTQAGKYQRFADALTEHGVATVAELPEEVGRDILRD